MKEPGQPDGSDRAGAQLDRVLEWIDANVPPGPAAKLKSVLRPVIRMKLRPMERTEGKLPIGLSRFGGVPDVPRDFVWPMMGNQPLEFLAQFNLSEVAPFDSEGLLPATGMLSFFVVEEDREADLDRGRPDASRVFYLESGELVRPEPPKPSGPTWDSSWGVSRVELSRELVMPSPGSRHYSEAGFTTEELTHARKLTEFVEEMEWEDDKRYERRRPPAYWLLGHPRLMTGELMDLVRTPEPIKRERAILKHQEMGEAWRLLLQVDSERVPGSYCEEKLLFWIREKDLREEVFRNVRLVE
jgi:hypothetical protein